MSSVGGVCLLNGIVCEARSQTPPATYSYSIHYYAWKWTHTCEILDTKPTTTYKTYTIYNIHLATFCCTMEQVGVVLGPGEGLNTPPFASFPGLSSFLTFGVENGSSECFG